MNFTLSILASTVLVFAAGCSGWITPDGHATNYSAVPADVENHPHYLHHGDDVYEVNGRYYQRHENQWVVFQQRPGDLEEPSAELHR